MPLRGETIGTAFVRVLLDGDGFKEDLRDSLRDSEDDFTEQGEKNAKAFNKGMKDENDKNKAFEKSMDKKMARIFGKMKADNEHFTAEWQEDFTKKLSKALRNAGESEADAEELGRRINARMVKGFNSGTHFDFATQLRPALAAARAEMDKMSASERRLAVKMREAEEANNSFRRGFLKFRAEAHEGGRDFDDLGDKFGHMFGKGARNDFINIVGVIVGGMVNIGTAAFRGIGAVTQWIGTLGKASEEGTKFAGMGEKAGAAFAKLAESGPVVVGVLAVVAAAVSTATALMSGLAAAATALVSSLAFAAAGALAPLAGALLPLGAMIGVSVLAFTNMDKAAKKLMKESLKPIKTEFKELGEIAAKSFTGAITENATRFGTALSGLRPIVRGVSAAMGDVMTGFAKSLNSPAFGRFKTEMGTFLPNAVRMLGAAITNSLGGMGGVFRSLIPITNQFLGWLKRITGEFSVWANSDAGQMKLRTFFQQAGESAKQVGKFIKAAAVALGELFSQGRGSGDQIFSSMTRSLTNFANYLRANQGAVREFFANGVSVARGLGGVILSVIKLFNLLDNSLSRKAASAFITSIIFMFDTMNGAITASARMLGLFASGLANVFGAIGKLPFQGWASGWSKSLDGTAKSLSNVGKSTSDAGGNASSAQSSYSSLAATIQMVGTNADSTTRKLIEQKLATTGARDAAASMGISSGTLVNATLGQKSAIDQVNAAMAKQKGSYNSLLNPVVAQNIAGLGGMFVNTAGKIVQATAKARGWAVALQGMPNKIQLAVETAGFEPSMNKMRNLARQFNLTPKQLKIIAQANGFDLTHRRLKILTADGKETGKQKPLIKVKADVKDATGKLKGINTSALKLAGVSKPVTAKVKTDSASAVSKMTDFSKKADVANKKKPSVTITVHNAAALASIRAVDRAMAGLSNKTVTITTVHAHVTRGKATASGGIFRSAQTRLIGEAGPEAVVPLARNLNAVDPAVRSLSAFAQGKTVDSSTTNSGKVYNFTEGSIQVQSNADNAKTVAAEFINRLVAVGY